MRAGRATEAGRGAADLQLLLLNRDLRVDAAAFVPAHRLQLVFVEGEELGPGEDPQTIHRPAERTARLVWTMFGSGMGAFDAGSVGGVVDSRFGEALGAEPGDHLLCV